MSKIDAERRDQIALTLFDLGLDTSEDWWNRQADALAPLVAGWLAAAWDEGYLMALRDVENIAADMNADNPYRDNPSKDGED